MLNNVKLFTTQHLVGPTRGLRLMDSDSWSLKNKEVFRIGLVDGLMDCHRVEP